jgi:hypothetical protein
MGGGLMQLVAYGAQDVYLTGNPQITFFKVVYRRHTNFSMETIQQTINGTSTLGAAKTSGTVTISRNGDLVHKLYVTSSTAAIDNGSEIVNEVELEIGGQRIDRHTAEWMQVWNELTTPESKAVGLKAMTGDVGVSGTTGVTKVHIPLQFWFCRNPGLALPLIALQYHEVKLKCTWGIGTVTVGANAAVEVWADYIYLDTDERRRFAQISHEYLIEQLQFTTVGTNTGKVQLNFNHPVKELIWTDSTDGTGTVKTKLTLNGHDRFAEQEPDYFQLRQPYDHHTAIPGQNLPIGARQKNAEFLDIGSGTKAGTTFEAEDFPAAGTAVSTTKVIVSQGGDGAADLSNLTAAVTTNEPETAATIIYSFLKTDLIILPVEGDIIEAEVSGVSSATNAVTATTTSFTIRGEVTGIADGALAGGLTNASNYHIQVNTMLTEASPGAEIDGADDFTINSFRVLVHSQARTSKLTRKINCYSFALKPEEHQPSGTCNFSRIDNANLITTATTQPTIGTIFAVNYNVLRIMSGMGGLAYSN